MNINELLSKCDHTLLSQTAVWDDIRSLCDDAVHFGVASVCIPPCFVRAAAEYLRSALPVCTVTGFPNGYNSTTVKCFEAATAISDGADEIDVVANIGLIKAGLFKQVEDELSQIRRICDGKILKIIIETCLLDDREKVKMCSVVSASGADYIKTSTGFSSGGATAADVALLVKHAPSGLLVKASGGIKTLADAESFISLGAARLGTSRIVALAKQLIQPRSE